MTDFTITTSYMITQQQIADLVTTALEDGITNEWLGMCEPPYEMHRSYSEASAYDIDMIPRTFSVDEDPQTYLFNRHAIINGLQILADKYPSHFGDLVNDNADADTADAFMQCALLGDIIYG